MQLLERDDHLATLGARLAEVRGCRRGQMVLLAGEAGVGKTALVRAFADAHPSVPALNGACEALFTPRPLGPPSGRERRPRRTSPRSALRTWRRWACA